MPEETARFSASSPEGHAGFAMRLTITVMWQTFLATLTSSVRAAMKKCRNAGEEGSRT